VFKEHRVKQVKTKSANTVLSLPNRNKWKQKNRPAASLKVRALMLSELNKK